MNFKRYTKKLSVLVAWMLLLAYVFSSMSIPAVSATAGIPLREKFGGDTRGGREIDFYESDIIYYYDILGEYDELGYRPVEDVTVEFSAASNFRTDIPIDQVPIWNQLGDREGRFLIWEHGIEWVEWTVEVEEAGLYNIEVDYYPLADTRAAVARDLMVNGEHLFDEMTGIKMPRFFRDAGAPRKNPLGDEVRPAQVEVPAWRSMRLEDVYGTYADPLMFYFHEGVNTIRMNFADQAVAFDKIRLVSPVMLKSYEEVYAEYMRNGYEKASDIIKFQAEENVVLKSDTTLVLLNNQDPNIEPYDIEHRLMNTIGGWQWRYGNQELIFEFEVEESGLYQIALRSLQAWNDGIPSHRQIRINGEVPFEELNAYPMYWDQFWELRTLTDDGGEPFLFYLEKGTNEISLKVKVGQVAPIIAQLTDDAFFLSVILQQIFLIAGSTPDVNYDYQFERRIPDLFTNLEKLRDNLDAHANFLLDISVKKSTTVDSIVMARNYIDRILDNPRRIVRNLDGLTVAQNAMSSAILSLQQQPLQLDYIYVADPEEELPNKKANLFQQLMVTWQNFMRSFRVDYDNIGGVVEGEDFELIDVWIARGREWSEAIKAMVDEEFTPDSRIAVRMNVLPASQLNAGAVNVLLLSMASGTAPDVGLAVAAASPVEFAIREAVLDLQQFDDFEEVNDRFLPALMVPFKYRGGVYALPETMNFRVMFYRMDIVQDMGFVVPETWEQLQLDTLPELYRNNMQFAFGGGGLAHADFTPFLFQSGGNFYNEAGTRSALDTPVAYNAFLRFTQLYTTYGMPAVQDAFYTKIRTGEYPMGIGTYAFYIQLSTAAPELKGKWTIAPIPGTKRPDGTIDRSIAGTLDTGGIILSQSEKPEQSWEFLKWWTSTDPQLQFGMEIESLIGAEAKWNTAALDAFNAMGWERSHLEVIQEQMVWYREIPIVLGGYFTLRHIMNAWTDVVLNDVTPREALERAVRHINRELRVKQEEYGIDPAQEEARVAALRQQEGSGQ